MSEIFATHLMPKRISATFLSLFLLWMLLTVPSYAQQNAWDAAPFSAEPKALLAAAAAIPKEKNADVVVLRDEITVSIDATGRSKQVTRLVYRVDTASGVENWDSTSCRYSPWHQAKPIIRARVITPDGIAHELDPKTLNDVTLKDDSENVYSDDHSLRGPLPAVTIGSIIEEQVTSEDTAPFFDGQWSSRIYFGRGAPVLHTVLSVTTPSEVTLKYRPQLLPNVNIEKAESNGRTTFTFDQGRLEPQESERLLPPDVPRWPHIALTTATSWHDLASRYESRIKSQVRPDEVVELVKGITGSDDEKIAAILARVHANARYTGIEFGESSIIPQPPSETLKRKYGDCKDKATLLVSMLRAAGIPANLVLLNAGGGYDVDPNIPGMNLFDHAIAYLPTKDTFIDATAEYSRYRDLPSDDQGRLALIVSGETQELKRIPELPSSANRQVEKRDIFLAEFGPARVVETTTAIGGRDAYFRSFYGGADNKQRRKELDDYVKSIYLAEGLTRFEHGDAADLTKPFTLRIEAAKAKRGNTAMNDAAAAVSAYDLVTQMIPSEMREEDRDAKRQDEDLKKKPRTADWYLRTLWQTEWQYRIVPPPGFSVRGLPENINVNFGPAVLTEEYKLDKDGTVLGTVRLDLGKRRYTNAEVEQVRRAFKDYGRRSVTVVSFDLTGHKLLQQGKVREGLQEIRQLAAMHPKEALHRAQLARAFLAASLGDMARVEAREATKLDPTSAEAFSTLGWVLVHDEAGREFEKGWDPAGAEAAYRKAVQLDPKNTEARLNLAVLLEYDAEGQRYSAGAKLKDAIVVYNDLKKVEDVDLDSVNDRLVYTMAYAGEFRALREMLASMAKKPLYNGMRVLATAALDGVAAAIRQAQDITDNEKAKSDALALAGNISLRSRLYKQASELMAAAAPGQQNAANLSNLAQLLQRTKRVEDIEHDPNTPAGFMLNLMLAGAKTTDRTKVESEFSRAWHKMPERYRENYFKTHLGFKLNSELPNAVLLDLGMTLSKMAVDGDDAIGYRVVQQVAGSKTDTNFLVKENGKLKWLADGKELAPLGQEVLDRTERGDLKGAKALLDWAREEVKLGGGEDPYAGSAFPRVWSKGQDPAPEMMRVAGAVLLSSVRGTTSPYVDQVASTYSRADEKEKAKLAEALLRLYVNERDWPHAEELARSLLAKAASPSLLSLLDYALIQQKKWDAATAAIEQYRSKLPDETAADRELAREYMSENQPAKAMAALKKVIDTGKADRSDFNQYGWASVMAGDVEPETMELVQTSANGKEPNYAMVHTLACMYAVAGRVKQAQEMLVSAMKIDPSPGEPNSVIWYGFARLAENYGETEAAARLYRKVQNYDVEDPDPAATYALAQQRLLALSPKGGIAAGK
jgi:Flp pilus assembly protein TadD